MSFEVLYTYVHSLDHVEEFCLEDQGVAWVVEHTGSVLQFLEVAKPLVDSIGDAQQVVLGYPNSSVFNGTKEVAKAYPLFEKLFTSTFQTLTALLD